MTDAELLGKFVRVQDQAAFRALVVRHGPRVLRVCRCVLHDAHDVEDAFQATFLVLVKKAPAIRDPDLLGNWLHGVARRVAARARRRAAVRREHERHRAEMLEPGWEADHSDRDLGRVLREELGRLPENYRMPIELCYLEGLSHEEAAATLGWPVGTVKTRLVRGRRRLRERLDRRGVLLGLGLLFLLLPRASRAGVPDELVDATVEAMTLKAAGRGALLASRHRGAAALADSLLRTGLRARTLWALLVVVGVSVVAAGTTVVSARRQAARAEADAWLPANLMDVLNIDCR